MTSNDLGTSARSTVKRLPDRSVHERDALHAILDEGLVCHVGFTTDNGPVVIPTAYCRLGEHIYLHGSPASRMLRSLKNGVDVCVTVTHLDGLVMARSAFHHSMNYRSAVIFGTATVVEDLSLRAEVLDGFVDHVAPGRSKESRPGNDKELKGTLVLELSLAEASVKSRTGPPVDDEEDYDLGFWAGVIPVGLATGPFQVDDRVDVAQPASVEAFAERHAANL